MAVRLTPEQLAAKWGNRLKGASEDIRQGVERVQEAPGRKAAAKVDKWVARLTDPATRRKWQNRVGAVSVDDWKNAIISKGIPRIAQGVDAAQPKMVRFAEQLIPYQNNLLTEIERMPDITLEDSINRMTAWIRGMAKFEVKE